MKYLLLLITSHALFSHSLLDTLTESKPGIFTVYALGELYTVLILKSNKGGTLVIEELQVEKANAPAPGTYASWIKSGGPKSAQHLSYTLNVKTRSIQEVYSYKKGAPLNTQHFQSTFGTLLTLPLTQLPTERMRKVGPPPRDGETDRRKVWTPPAVYMGKKARAKNASAYESTWPKDNSELSSKKLEAYFSQESPFPIWIQVIDPGMTYRLANKDSGILY